MRAPRLITRLVLLGTAIAASAVVAAPGPALASGSTPAPGATAVPAPSPEAPGTSPSAGPGQATFGLGPSTGGTLDRRTGFTFLLPRGSQQSDEITVVNLSYTPLTLNLYPADGLNTTTGSIDLQPRAVKPVDAAAWLKLKTPTGKLYVVVPARGRVAVPFTVSIPKNAAVGDHLAGIATSIVAQNEVPGERGTDVAFEQRVALRVAIRVAGELKPQLSLQNLAATYAGTLNPVGQGSALVTYTVVNTGNVRLGGKQTVRVSGALGPVAEMTGLADVPVLLPGGSAQVSVEVPDVTPAIWDTASVTVVPQAVLGDADPPADIATASVSFWAVPWTLIAAILLLSGLVFWWWRQRRKRAEADRAAATGRRVRGAEPAEPRTASSV